MTCCRLAKSAVASTRISSSEGRPGTGRVRAKRALVPPMSPTSSGADISVSRQSGKQDACATLCITDHGSGGGKQFPSATVLGGLDGGIAARPPGQHGIVYIDFK